MNFFDPTYSLETPIKWICTINQLYIDLIAIGAFIFLSLVLPKKNKILVNITKIFFACILVGFEIARICYRYKGHVLNGGNFSNFDLIGAISFQQCAMMVWFTVITLILSTILKKGNILLKYMYNICFSCALIGALTTLVYPENLSESLPLWHFRNLETYVVHSLEVYIPIYLMLTKDYKPRIYDAYITPVGYIYIGSISMTVSIVTDHNFAFAKYIPLDSLPKSMFPWHLEALFVIMSLSGVLLYLLMELIYFINRKIKKTKEEVYVPTFKNSYKPIVVTLTSIIASFMLMLISKAVGVNKTINGMYCIIPLFYMIITLIIIEISNHYILIDKMDKKKYILFISLFLIFNPIASLILMIKYNKNFKNISQ